MHYTTQSSGPDSQLFEEFSKQFFPQQNLSKLAPINLPKDEVLIFFSLFSNIKTTRND